MEFKFVILLDHGFHLELESLLAIGLETKDLIIHLNLEILGVINLVIMVEITIMDLKVHLG